MIWLVACAPPLPGFEGVPLEAAPAQACREPEEVRVACVVDGDTIHLGACDGGETVRLLGIDAPEVDTGDCYADEAQAWLDDVLVDREVTLTFDEACEDVYGRTLAYVWLRGESAADERVVDWVGAWAEDPGEDAALVSEVLLGEGLARPLLTEGLALRARLDDAAAAAQAHGRGLWGACGAQ